jgi:hypothetical protein
MRTALQFLCVTWGGSLALYLVHPAPGGPPLFLKMRTVVRIWNLSKQE